MANEISSEPASVMARYLFLEGMFNCILKHDFSISGLTLVILDVCTNILVSPCVEPTDAKILPVLKSKPQEMRETDWNMLCNYKFGTIIFGLPNNEDDIPMPVSCLVLIICGINYF